MEMTQYLQAVNSVDPEKMIAALQEFFNKINSAESKQGLELLSLYSTVSILEINGLNKDSVKVIKMAIKLKIYSLYNQYPHSMREIKSSVDSLAKAEGN